MNTDLEPVVRRDIDPRRLRRAVYGRVVLGIVVLGLLLFLPAGTIRYWQAWVYMAILFTPMIVLMVHLLEHDPELLERRMRMKERQTEQKGIVVLSSVLALAAFLIPGFDRRFGWSPVPVVVVVVADMTVVLGYGLFVRVLLENRYASRVVEVEQGQKVVTTGPYALVRHPMYLAASVMFVFSPLALGSTWGLIPGALVPIPLVQRIAKEEKLLLEGLEGYREYTSRTRHRLLPGIW